jgi:hypothetical protein
MRKIHATVLAGTVTALLLPAAAHARPLRAPALVQPVNNASVQQLGTVTWGAVRGGAVYEYQISGDPRFASIVGSGRTHNLAAALPKLQPDSGYWWRIRALTAKGTPGRWSRVRRIAKRWTEAPRILSGDGVAISWPQTPLVLRWSQVPYAYKYIVTIATDPALSDPVLGSVAQPVYTQGNSFTFPGTLADGSYYWAITPVDAEGHRGIRSRIGTFSWSWPTATSTSVTDLNPDSRVFDPFFSWNPIPGAARYEVEINSAADFPVGSKWCCDAPTIGTSLAPPHVLGNNGYYWRVRAVDANGHTGQWNYGTSFTKQFDSVSPTIPDLTVRDANGNALSGTPSTDTPIVTWDPVPGASRYEVQLGKYTSGICDWSIAPFSPYHATTATTAWTPLASNGTFRPGPSAWPNPQSDLPLPTGTYCLRVLARSDDDARAHQVVSDWTYLNSANDPNQPAFTSVAQPSLVNQTFATFTPASAYIAPVVGAATPRTPLFTWNWLPGAQGYYVVIARDALFTQVVDVGFTNVPAYAPRMANGEPLNDETTDYYWAVIPTAKTNGSVFNDDVLQDAPRNFNKSSIPPTPLAPQDGSSVSTWPTFRWTGAENARMYRLEVSQDPSFGKLLDDVTTDATAYTSSSTYPADTVLYWRVRANDWTGQGLNWSAVQTFTRHLPGSAPLAGNPLGGDGLPVESWAGVSGAIAYDIHIDQGDGTSTDVTVDSTSFAATSRHGIGTISWQVRPLFPSTTLGTIGGPFFSPQPYLLTLRAPTGVRGVRNGSRTVISWAPDPAAQRYQVDVSPTQSFSTLVAFQRVDGTSWAPDIDYALPANRGRLYWRVAAVDSFGTIGSYATGSFRPMRRASTHAVRKHKPRRRHK